MTEVEKFSLKEARQQYREFFGSGEFRYQVSATVYRSGKLTNVILGEVQADNEFLAEKLAYDYGLWRSQATPPIVTLLGPVKGRETLH